MVIYDQRTAISATRLSANASLMFSSLSHLFLAAPFHGPFAKFAYICIRSYHIRCFPLPTLPGADHFQNTQSLGEYAQISAALLDGEVESGKEMEPFSRKLSSVHLLSLSVQLSTACTFVWQEVSDVGVIHYAQSVPMCA